MTYTYIKEYTYGSAGEFIEEEGHQKVFKKVFGMSYSPETVNTFYGDEVILGILAEIETKKDVIHIITYDNARNYYTITHVHVEPENAKDLQNFYNRHMLKFKLRGK